MPRNSSGIYTLPGGNPVTPGDVIEAEWANTTLEDVADALTNSLSRTGAGGMLAPFRISDGNVSGPGLSYLNETNSGLYRSGSGSVWMSILGVNTAQFSTVGLTIPFGKALTAQGNASVSGTLAVTGATTLASTLSVTGAITATGGVTGNVTGNVTAATGTSTFNDVVITGALDMTAGSSATITGLSDPTNASDAANKSYVDAQVATRLALTGGTMSGAIAMGNSKVTGLATPTADADAATKAYVDSVAQGLDVKGSCRVGTTANITLSGTQTIDGVAVIAGDRVLVKNQSAAAENGIYVVAAGSWSRSADADTWSELVGAFTFVEEGTVNDNSGWVCTSPAGGTLGVTAVTWEQFSGAGQITAGAGMYKSGNTLNVGTASSARIVVGTDDIDLATTGVTASTYKSVTVDAYGRVTAGTNPTTLAGFGITDAYTQAQVDSALALKLSLTGGTMSGVIAMGANKITGLADPTNPQDAATKIYIDTIFGSTTTAAASAAAAAASASAASSSASSALSSATAAAGSATSAASSYTTFNNQYLGSKTSDPSSNNSGGALVAGNLYWNSTASEMRVYNGSAWVSAYLPAAGYLALTGGTMTGAITFSNTQTWPTFNQNTTGTAFNVTGTVGIANGGTGITSTPSNGQIPIGNGSGYTLATLTGGSGISVTNASGSITIASTGSLPSQTGNAGKFLTTDGTTASWGYVPVVPGAPANVTATASSTSGQIDVSWTALSPSLNVTSYLIFYSTTSPVTTLSPYVTVYTNSGSITGLTTTYVPVYIAVVGVNDFGTGALSLQTSATPNTLPAAPTIVSASVDSLTSARVVWTGSSGGTPTPTYRLYYSTTSPVTTSSSYITASSSPTTLTGLSASTTYYLAIGAVNSQGTTLSSQTSVSMPPSGTVVYSAGQSFSISAKSSLTFLMDGSCTGMRLRCAGAGGGGGGGWNASGAAGGSGGYADAQILRSTSADGVFVAYSAGYGSAGCDYAGGGSGGGASGIYGYSTSTKYVVAGGGGGGGSGWNGTAGTGGTGGIVVGATGVGNGQNGATTQIQGGLGGTTSAGTQSYNSACNGSGQNGGQGGRAGGTAGSANNSNVGSGGSCQTDYYWGGGGGGGGYFGGAGGYGSSAGDGGGGGSSYVNPTYCTAYSYGGSQPSGGYGGGPGGSCGGAGGNGFINVTFY